MATILNSPAALNPAFWHAGADGGSVSATCATVLILVILSWIKSALAAEIRHLARKWQTRRFRLASNPAGAAPAPQRRPPHGSMASPCETVQCFLDRS